MPKHIYRVELTNNSTRTIRSAKPLSEKQIRRSIFGEAMTNVNIRKIDHTVK